MWNIIAAGGTYLFPGGRALKLVKNGVNVTNSTNPVTIGSAVHLISEIYDNC